MMDDYTIKLDSISISYGDHLVIDKLSASFPRGQITCLMGPNGSGKTTLIDGILGLNKVSEGTILLDNEDIKNMKVPSIARKVAYVPQLHSITFPFTVKEVVMMGRTAYQGLFGSPKKDDEDIALGTLKKVGLYEYRDRPYSELSGGEIKLVLLARALGQCADIIIMDEPTAHLDLKNELIFLETVARIVKEDKKTVLITTHSPEHAFYFERMGVDTNVMLLKGGKIVDFGKASKIITTDSIIDVFGVDAEIITSEDGGKSICLKTTLNK